MFGNEFDAPITLDHIAVGRSEGGMDDDERTALLRSIERLPEAIPS